MKWATLILLASFFYSALTAETEDGAPFLHVMAKSSVFNVGEKKAIYCKGLNLPERIDWVSPSDEVVEIRSSRNTRVYVERHKNDTLSSSLVPLIFHSIKIKDSGNWTCKAGNLNETIEILVGEKVSLSERQETLEGEETKSVKLDCVAKGYPAPVVQWYKDSVSIVDDHKKFIVRKKDNNYQLEIKNLTHQDTGEYMCKVTQKALSYYTYKRVLLSVQHKPILINEATNEVYYTKYRTEEVYAILNETKNITCSALAYPPPTYTWSRRRNNFDDDPINEEDTIHSADGTSSVLVLRMYNESNLGEYKCAAKNDKGHVSVVFHVSLGNKPNPPDFLTLASRTKTELTFNVSCSTCNMAIEEDDKSQDPENLTVLGYSFQLVPAQEGYLPDWAAATEFEVNFEYYNESLFTVGPLQNQTTYHVRVRTRNAAGYSEWVELSTTVTTDFAVKLTASIILMFVTLFITRCY
ncbi:neural cell adhesion molecule 1-like [Danaus plexippus]|uniref:neural cell adhesion molecule 1-like n=1 Tax=Danaus plexippus TaxID=13037 RepID=UPI0013C5300F|nr:neural cell adhesion molecule 1-like [Danaus plexippus]